MATQIQEACARFGAALPTLILMCLLVVLGFDVAFGRANLFGDVEEALPGGYALSALAKMPQDGLISREGSYSGASCVGEIAVRGEEIAGRYDASHFPCNQQPPKEKPYFVLNSRTEVLNEYSTPDQLNAAFGTEAHFTPTGAYHAPLTIRGRAANVMWTVLFCLGPTWLAARFARLCRRDRLEQMTTAD